MQSQTHISRKELKSMDRFQTRLVMLLEWFLKNLRYILYGLAPIVGIVIVALAWQYFSNKKSDERSNELGKVDVVYSSEIQAAEKQKDVLRKQAEELENNARKTAGIKPGEEALKKFELDAPTKAKKDALEKQINDIKPNHANSLAGFKDFFEKHPKNVEGWSSGMRAAAILSDEQKIDAALPIVEQIAAAAAKDPFYSVQSRIFLAGLLEEKGDFDRALSEISTLEATASEDIKPSLLLTKGRLQLLKNTKEEAKATFTTIIDKYASSAEAQKARSLKGLLN